MQLTLDFVSQLGIFIFGCLAILLLSRTDKWQRWGFVSGCISQPFWFYTLIHNEQWLILVPATIYTYGFIKGVCNHFHLTEWLRQKRG